MNFNSKSRKVNSLLSSGAGIVNQLAQLLGNFVYRTVFLMVLSREYLGINGLFTNVLQVFSLAELGIGSAILYNMYGAFARQDTDKIGQLVGFYKKIYSLLALLILGIGVAFYPFLGSIVNVEEIPADVSLPAVYFLFVLNSVASYLFVYKQSLLSADQREYAVKLFATAIMVLCYVVRIVILFLTEDYVLVLAAGIVLTILMNWLFSLWITRKYHSVFQVASKLPEEERKEIYKSTRGLLCHKIGTVVVTSTDNIVISKFVSLAAVGLYSNYGTLVSAITNFGVSLINGMLPSIANFTATATKDETYTMLKRIMMVDLWLTSWTSVCLFTLLNPFITVWLDESYLLSYAVVAVVCLQHYLQTSRLAVNNFVYSAGLFMRDRIRPLIESVINLAVSVVLAKQYGIIGVFIGTCVSGLLTYYWREPYLLFKHHLKRSSLGYWGIQAKWFLLTVALCAGMYWLFSLLPGGLLWLLCRFALAAVLPNLVILLTCVGTEEFWYFVSFVKSKFLHQKG